MMAEFIMAGLLGLAGLMLFRPEWVTNHLYHWIFGNESESEED
jgi:hypothetical protein